MTADLWQALRAGLTPDKPMTVSEWASAFRVLPATSAAPGRYRLDKTPYAKEPMDCLGLGGPQTVVLMWGAQLGKSELGNNWLGWIVDQSPGPTLLVQPTVERAEEYSRERIAPLISDCPRLAERIADPRSRDSNNRLLGKQFAGGFFKIVGANAPSGLASTPIRRVFLDEVDRFPADAGGEGDPVALARQRTETFSINRKLLLTSTPTQEGFSRIETAYRESDRRRFWVPCPHCDGFQVLQWRASEGSPGGVTWPKGRPEEAVYSCGLCGAAIDNTAKNWMLPRGQWRAENPGAPSAGFHLSALYSPVGWTSWGALAREFVEAGNDPDRLKVFVNTKLAETFKAGQASEVKAQGLQARAEVYGAQVPDGVALITCAVDTQDDRLEGEIVGWGAGEESWSLLWFVIPGNPGEPYVWAELDRLLKQELRRADGVRCKIQATAIDSGGHHTSAVYAFCRGKEARRVWAIKGAGGARPLWPRRPTRRKSGAMLYVIGVDSGKESVVSRLRIREPGPGFLHFSADHPAEYYEQLTAERREVTLWRGRQIQRWVLPPGKRNEALDCRVYNYAALHGLLMCGHRLPQSTAAQVAAVQVQAHTVAEPAAFVPQPAPRPTPAAPPKRVRKPSIYDELR